MNERTHLIGADEPGFWGRRTTLQKTLVILAGLAVVAAVVAAIALTVGKSSKDNGPNDGGSTTEWPSTTVGPTDAPTGTPSTTTSTPATTTKPPVISVCQTEMCYNEASRIQQNMNKDIGPCDDFFGYVCGSYQNNHSIPDDKGRYGAFDAVEENVVRRLQDLYDSTYVSKEIEPLTFVRYLYQGCNDSNALENQGVKPLVDVLGRLGGWPLAGNATNFTDSYSLNSAFMELTGSLHNNVLLNIAVQPDPKNTARYVVILDQPDFGVGRQDLINYHNDTQSKKLVDAYKTFVKATTSMFHDDTVVGIDEQIAELVEFEIDLAAASMSPEDRRDHEASYHSMTFDELGKLTFNFDWFLFVENLYNYIGSPVKINPDDEVVILDLPYLLHLSKSLYENQGNKSTVVANYIGWRFLQQNGFMSTAEFRKNEADFEAVRQGVTKPVELWKRCLNFAVDQVPTLVGRTYVDKWFTEDNVQKATQIVSFVSGAFEKILNEKDWLDAETKPKALNKLKKVTENVGFPNWIKNDTELIVDYKFEKEVDKTNPFESAMYIREFMERRMFNKLRRPVDKSREWPMGPSIVNAAYEPTQNSITIPAGILQLVFFDEARPNYLNYGSIGSVIGHELTHGFDDEGAQYDEAGNMQDWWSNATHTQFNSRAKCFVDQYGSIRDDRVNLTLNGKNTLGENIADNGGLREAYFAYHDYVGSFVNIDGLLPGFQDYTVEQLFFISYGNNWCSLIRDEKLRQSILYDPHSPPKYRINVPVSNFDKFSEAFGCNKGSNMNPTERCVLW